MADDSGVTAFTGDLPVKRPREEGVYEENNENGVSASTVSAEMNDSKEPDYISSVIPGWFSEISPMWPGQFSSFLFSFFPFLFNLIVLYLVGNFFEGLCFSPLFLSTYLLSAYEIWLLLFRWNM